MTGPHDERHARSSLQPAADCASSRPRPVAFADPAELARELDRRANDRRDVQDRRQQAARSTAAAQLGARQLCHDLRQPLATATVLTHLVEREGGLSAAGRTHVTLLRQELRRLGDMLSSHLEPRAPELVDLARTAEDVCAEVGRTSTVGIELVVESRPLALGDPTLLARMLQNLVANACSAAGTGGRVRVSTEQGLEGASLVVEDSGPASDTESAPGYGLGLMIVDSVAARHGGHVQCAASALGGLLLRVVLPSAVPGQTGPVR